MGFRFRRTLSFAPGVRLNLTHRGLGVSLGPRGASHSIHTSGRRTVTVGLPGSGAYWSESWTSRGHRHPRKGETSPQVHFSDPVAAGVPTVPTQHEPDPGNESTAGPSPWREAIKRQAPTILDDTSEQAGAAELTAVLRALLRPEPDPRDDDRELLAAALADPDLLTRQIKAAHLSDAQVVVHVTERLCVAVPMSPLAVALVLAEQHQRHGRVDAALKILDDFDDELAKVSRADILLAAGRAAALTVEDPPRPDGEITAAACVLHAEALAAIGRPHEALVLLKAVLRCKPASEPITVLAHTTVCRILLGLGQPTRAREHLMFAEMLDPDGAEVSALRDLLAIPTTLGDETTTGTHNDPKYSCRDPSYEPADPQVATWHDPAELAVEQELIAVESALLEAEVELATLRAQLDALNVAHLHRCGPLYAKLDELDALIAIEQAMMSGDPADDEAASRARAKAEETARQVQVDLDAQPQLGTAQTAPEMPAEAPIEPSTKKLYRELARRCHPDLAPDEHERSRRERFMAMVNVAYARGDTEELARLASEWESRPENAPQRGEPDRLDWLRSRIALLHRNLTRVPAEIAELRASALGQMLAAGPNADATLASIAVTLSDQIAKRERELAAWRARRTS